MKPDKYTIDLTRGGKLRIRPNPLAQVKIPEVVLHVQCPLRANYEGLWVSIEVPLSASQKQPTLSRTLVSF